MAMLLGVWGMRKGLQVLLGGGCVCQCCVAVVRSAVSSAAPRIGRRGEGLVGDRKKWVGVLSRLGGDSASSESHFSLRDSVT